MPWGTIELSALKLDQKNIRIGDQPDQPSALRALIEEQERKLVNLAQDLAEFGPSPGEPIWVTPDTDDPGRYIVLEGNRRVAALKILDTPLLAARTKFADQFAKIAKAYSGNPRRTLEAQIFSSREEAEPWIERRHMSTDSGVGLDKWGSLALERHRAKGHGPIRRSLLVLNYLDDGTPAFETAGIVINEKATTVDRLLNSPAMVDVLGIHIDRSTRDITFENGDEVSGRRLLRDLISAMAAPGFSFNDIRDKEGREVFIRRYADRSVKATGRPTAAPRNNPTPAAASAAPPETVISKPQKRLTERTRRTLAPYSGDRTIEVTGKRLNKIYNECRKIKLDEYENSAALLLRVFVELSSETFLIEKNIPIPINISAKNTKTNWSDFGIKFKDKIEAVLTQIDTTAQTKKSLKKMRVALSTSHSSGSIDTLHAYIHNVDMFPGIAELREAWDTWEPYLRLLHEARK